MSRKPERHRIKIADMEGNFLHMTLRLQLHEVGDILTAINRRSNCAARYEREVTNEC